jgi:acrylyl-CoA reductase (NADPH)
MMFRAIQLDRQDDRTAARITDLDDSQLPDADVTVRVQYSTLNYKDGLAITGKGPVVRKFPMVPGIDFAGTVEASGDPRFKPGDAVLLNGWGVGEAHWGGLAQKARVKADWLVPMPDGISARHAMAIGTAGYTAMLCVQAIEKHGLKPGDGDVLVTGANGGVGGVAIALLKGRGYRVIASTGRVSEAEHLKALGAADVIDRNELSSPGKPLAKERWAGVVDSVGSHTLVNACAATRYRGIVTACGLAQGMDFPATVAPFILRGVTLAGIDSVMAPFDVRRAAWEALAKELPASALDALTREVPLGDVPGLAEELLAGKVRGRIIVDVNA